MLIRSVQDFLGLESSGHITIKVVFDTYTITYTYLKYTLGCSMFICVHVCSRTSQLRPPMGPVEVRTVNHHN